MGSKSDYFENQLLKHIFEDASLGLNATNLWIALATAAADGSFTEATYTNYARVALNRTSGSNVFTVTSNSVTNDGTISFPSAGSGPQTITHFGIMDASTAGNVLYWGTVSPNLIVNNGDPVTFGAGQLTITED